MFQKISGYLLIISGLIVLATFSCSAQKITRAFKDSTRIKEKQYRLEARQSIDSFRRVRKILTDSIHKKNDPDTVAFRKNLRLGIDLSKPIGSFFKKGIQEAEFSVDYHFRSRLYLAAEAGLQLASISRTGLYQYRSTGEYVRAGFDYSIFRIEKKNDANIVFVGVRLAGANVGFKTTGIQVPDAYFGNSSASSPSASDRQFWLELLAGIKVDLSQHISIGWTLRLASSLNDLTKKDTYPILIPGFGSSASSTNFTYNYSIYYSF